MNEVILVRNERDMIFFFFFKKNWPCLLLQAVRGKTELLIVLLAPHSLQPLKLTHQPSLILKLGINSQIVNSH